MATQWDSTFENTPTNTESAGKGDDRIRELKVEIRERLQQGGHVMQDSDPANDGKHCTGGDTWRVYKTDKSTPAMLVYDDTIKAGSGVTWRTAADTPVTYQRRALIWTLPYEIDFTGHEDICFIPLPCPVGGEGEYGSSVEVDLVEFRIAVRTPSDSATTLKVDLLRCPAGSDPTDENFTTILTAPVELATSEYEAVTASFDDTITLAYNDKLIIDIAQTDDTNPVAYLTATLVLRW